MIKSLNWLQQTRTRAPPDLKLNYAVRKDVNRSVPEASVANFPVTQDILSIASEKNIFSKQKL